MLETHVAWGWQPALYLFFGGLGAGAFITATLLFFRAKSDYQKAIATAAWLSFACLVVGLLLLVLELTQPLRGLLLWQSFSNFSSWMTIGAWLIFLAVIVFGIAAVLMTERLAVPLGKLIKPLSKLRNGICSLLFGLGALLGLGVAAYTGILLMAAPGVPFWNSLLLPCLFTVSALDTGIAAVEVIIIFLDKKKANPDHKTRRILEIAVIALVAIESVVLFVYLDSMFSGGNYGSAVSTYAEEVAAYTSAFDLANGKFALLFWGLVVGCGLGVPLLAAIGGLFIKSKVGSIIVLVGATGALVGGCVLRFLVLYAGVHADFISDAAYWLVY
jgi:formate-dependent nitrite reductase membrane component NrfD